MAFHRRSGQRFAGAIWPGFVDAITSLLMVMIFVLTIFMVVQFVLREEIDTQGAQLEELTGQLNLLGDALGLAQARNAELESRVATLGTALSGAEARIASFEEQVASLIAQNTEITAARDAALAERDASLSREEALNLALATARDEVDQAQEEARLAAARRAAIEAMLAEMEGAQSALQEQVSEAEAARLADAAALAQLRERLAQSDTEMTALTLALEEARARAEETLTLLAAARAAQGGDLQSELSEREALLAVANQALSEAEAQNAAAQREVELLNQQVAALRTQLAALEATLDASEARDADAQVQIENLGARLNSALAQVASEQRIRADLEAAEAARLERYASEFFGRLREVLEGREGVRIEGDRFVFSSEVLFDSGSAQLRPEGLAQIANVAGLLQEVAQDIPPEINWVIRVDGHTDNIPVRGGAFASNWELSTARALSVVRYMSEELGIAPERLAAAGFGEYQPANPANTPEARAQNRRIELKLTER